MILIGLIFIGAALTVGIDVWQQDSGHVLVQGFGHTFSQPPWVVLVVGAVCGALLVLGLGLLDGASARGRRLRREHRALLRERDRLAEQAQAERAGRERAERERAVAAVDRSRIAGTVKNDTLARHEGSAANGYREPASP
jgi:hypothetical protein